MNDTEAEQITDREAAYAEIAINRRPLLDKYKVTKAASQSEPRNPNLANAAQTALNEYMLSSPLRQDIDKILNKIRNERIADREAAKTPLIAAYKAASQTEPSNPSIKHISTVENIVKTTTDERGGRRYKSKKHRKSIKSKRLKGSRRTRRSKCYRMK